MQTFLPYPSFKQSAECLDRQRLGKQRVEAYQILRALHGITKGWRNHPATLMWKGYESALAAYAITCCEVWIARGYKDTLKDKISMLVEIATDPTLPEWFGVERFHASHRSALLRKDPEHYGQFEWTDDVEGYWWPSPKEQA